MATQKESESAETLAGRFTDLTHGLDNNNKLDDNGNLGSDQNGNSLSVSVDESETLAGGFTELSHGLDKSNNNKLDENGNLGSDQNGNSEQDGVGEICGERNEFVGDGISLLVQVHGTMENEKEEQLAKAINEDATEEEPQTEAINEDGKSGNEADDDTKEDSVEHTYCVGDYVWGKIKSHPWWPGRIYDPSHASEFAIKYSQKDTDRLLVVYFGDGSFSWCLPSQLKPFAENFEEMSKQSGTKGFLNAVDKAVDEIGTLLVLERTCQCIPQHHISLPPLAVNAGIKAGVVVPKGDTRTLSLPSYEPQLVLLKLRDLARNVPLPSRLEFVGLTSWLSAFYRSKGGYQLSAYCEPSLIEGLEDKTRDHAVDGTDEEEEWVSYRNTGPGNCPVIADDKLFYPRKQKSVAELMGENDGFAQVTETGIKECRNETGYHSLAKVSKKRNPLSIKCSEDGDRNNAGEVKEESERSPLSRERKKSKYLSPPYTSPRWITGKSSGKRDFEVESEKISKTARVGEKMMTASAEMKDKETQNHEMIPEPGTMHMNASINQVLTEVQSTAIDTQYSSNSESFDMVREFMTAFRKSVYLNLNGTDYKSMQSGGKRKSLCSLTENHVSATNAKSQIRRKKAKVSEAGTSEPKKSGETEEGKEVVPKKSFPVLIVTFSPGYPLPSKEELVRVFSRYGELNEKETNTYYNSNCAQVVYENGSDAVAAFKESVKQSPLGTANVNYRLRHSPDASSAFGSIKHNLDILKSMLSKCNGELSQEEKIELEGEIKGLLEKVSTMDVVAP